jgi:hypothetical protein
VNENLRLLSGSLLSVLVERCRLTVNENLYLLSGPLTSELVERCLQAMN